VWPPTMTYLDLVAETLSKSRGCLDSGIDNVAAFLDDAVRIYTLGNGGSAATAEHFASDLARRGLPAMALGSNTAFLTAVGNDVGYGSVFEKAVATFCTPKDMVVAFSGSGRSTNVIKAVIKAKKIGALTVGVTGSGSPNPLRVIVDITLDVDTRDQNQIEDVHAIVCHAILDTWDRKHQQGLF